MSCSTSYGVYISQLIRFARASSFVADFNTCNILLTQKLLKQGYQYHKLHKTFSKLYRRYYNLISKFVTGLKSLLHQGLWEPDFYGDLVYKLKKIIGSNNFLAQFIKIISCYKKLAIALMYCNRLHAWWSTQSWLATLLSSLIAKLDYGCIIYGSARKSYLQILDPIHNQVLRLALGAFRTSPVASLYVEADEPSLYSRREKLSLQYAIRLAANPSNPAHEVTFPPNYVDVYEQKR